MLFMLRDVCILLIKFLTFKPFCEIYNAPPNGEMFQYPDSAYGVMSWWDYGHVITYFAHPIPHANPFQAGIGGSHGCWWVLLAVGMAV